MKLYIRFRQMGIKKPVELLPTGFFLKFISLEIRSSRIPPKTGLNFIGTSQFGRCVRNTIRVVLTFTIDEGHTPEKVVICHYAPVGVAIILIVERKQWISSSTMVYPWLHRVGVSRYPFLGNDLFEFGLRCPLLRPKLP